MTLGYYIIPYYYRTKIGPKDEDYGLKIIYGNPDSAELFTETEYVVL